jgi:hypothetical protein
MVHCIDKQFNGRKLQDPKKRKYFYNAVSKDYDLGTWEEFNSKMDSFYSLENYTPIFKIVERKI